MVIRLVLIPYPQVGSFLSGSKVTAISHET